jgi:hypothetical protein
MSAELTLKQAAQSSGLGLPAIMTAIRSGLLPASRCDETGFRILERDLDVFVRGQCRPSGSVTSVKSAFVPPQQRSAPPSSCGGAVDLVRNAFGPAAARQTKAEPPAPPNTPLPLDTWCERYGSELARVAWLFRKLEADAAWLESQLMRKAARQEPGSKQPKMKASSRPVSDD